jgi:hypothetical protein
MSIKKSPDHFKKNIFYIDHLPQGDSFFSNLFLKVVGTFIDKDFNLYYTQIK